MNEDVDPLTSEYYLSVRGNVLAVWGSLGDLELHVGHPTMDSVGLWLRCEWNKPQLILSREPWRKCQMTFRRDVQPRD